MNRPAFTWYDADVAIRAGVSWLSIFDHRTFSCCKIRGVDQLSGFCSCLHRLYSDLGRGLPTPRDRFESITLTVSAPLGALTIERADAPPILLDMMTVTDIRHWHAANSGAPLPSHDDLDKIAVQRGAIVIDGFHYRRGLHYNSPVATALCATLLEAADEFHHGRTYQLGLGMEIQAIDEHFYRLTRTGYPQLDLSRGSLVRLAMAIRKQEGAC